MIAFLLIFIQRRENTKIQNIEQNASLSIFNIEILLNLLTLNTCIQTKKCASYTARYVYVYSKGLVANTVSMYIKNGWKVSLWMRFEII